MRSNRSRKHESTKTRKWPRWRRSLVRGGFLSSSIETPRSEARSIDVNRYSKNKLRLYLDRRFLGLHPVQVVALQDDPVTSPLPHLQGGCFPADDIQRLGSGELRERDDVLPHGRVGCGLTDPVAGLERHVSVQKTPFVWNSCSAEFRADASWKCGAGEQLSSSKPAASAVSLVASQNCRPRS